MSVRIPTFEEILAVSQSRGGRSYAPGLWDGLVSAWPLQEGGGLTAFDASGYGNHGTLTNMDPATDRVVTEKGKAIDFNPAAAEAVSLSGFVLDTSQPWTIAWWSKLDAYTDTYPGEWNLATDQATGFVVYHNTSDVNYRPFQFGSSANFVQRKVVTDWSAAILGTWQHYALVYNGAGRTTIGNYRLFRNATEESLGAPGTFATTPNTSRIGWGSTTATEFDGQINHFSVWNYELSSSEIARLYADPWAMYRQRRRVFAAAAGAPSAGKPTHFMYYQRLRRAG